MGDDKLDAQTSARLLKRALAIKGSREKLAEALAVHPHDLALWLAGRAYPPEPVVEQVLEIILAAPEARPAVASAPIAAGSPRPRVLLADRPDGCAVLQDILGDEFMLVPVHTVTEGLDLLQGGTIAAHPSFDAIVCGQHFEGSQMLRFLECVKAYKPTRGIPFICCRATPTQLGGTALAAMREACEALGAVAYIDLPERQRHAGEETAAVEFRDAVRAAVRMRPPRERLRILVVDDNPDAAHTLSMLLQMAGHETYKASGGDEALRLARQVTPDVAVLDIGMQDMSGYALAQGIRAQPWGGAMTLIAVTGHSGSDEPARAREAGFDHHFTKPVTLEKLLEALPRRRG